MFTGIIEETACVSRISKGRLSAVLEIKANEVLNDLKIGDSICTNGVCLTVISFSKNSFVVDVMNETLKSSNLGSLKQGSIVNLERALTLNSRLGGHMVSGHIDGTGEIIEIKEEGIARLIRIKTKAELLKYMIHKGSVAVDGISLTIQGLTAESFQISIIPLTKSHSNIFQRKNGDLVNIETDLIAKYIERQKSFNQLHSDKANDSFDMNYLNKQGFISWKRKENGNF